MVIFHCYVSLPQGNMAAWKIILYRRYIFKWCFLSIVILVFRAVTCLELAGSWANWFNATPKKKASWGCRVWMLFVPIILTSCLYGHFGRNLLVIMTIPPKNHMKPEQLWTLLNRFHLPNPHLGFHVSLGGVYNIKYLFCSLFCSTSCHLGVMSSLFSKTVGFARVDSAITATVNHGITTTQPQLMH